MKNLIMRMLDAVKVPKAPKNSMRLFFDSSDNKPKYKDESGVVKNFTSAQNEFLAFLNIEPQNYTELNSGLLQIGKTYTITNIVLNDDFSNVANIIYGEINKKGCTFVATGTTPNRWSNGSTLITDLFNDIVVKKEEINTNFSVYYSSYFLILTSDSDFFIKDKFTIDVPFASITYSEIINTRLFIIELVNNQDMRIFIRIKELD